VKVVVTGGSGLAGRHVVADLVKHGHDVLNVDTTKPSQNLSPYKLVDVEDIGQVYGCLAGADAVVHLAAIPRPTFHTNEVVFRTNVMSLFNMLEAAATLGITRIVFASSVSVLGFPFFYQPLAPQYVPIDEDHPKLPQDPYALSKAVGETVAEAFVRRAGMTVVSLRFPWIHTPETFKEQLVPLWDDPASGASNLWAYIDGRDVAQACRLALETEVIGHEAFFVAAPNLFMKTPTVELVRRFYPKTEIRAGLDGNESLLSSVKAARVLGYRAQYSWVSYF
jgi:nucleoside-diphosphate-sugar epimerase